MPAPWPTYASRQFRQNRPPSLAGTGDGSGLFDRSFSSGVGLQLAIASCRRRSIDKHELIGIQQKPAGICQPELLGVATHGVPLLVGGVASEHQSIQVCDLLGAIFMLRL